MAKNTLHALLLIGVVAAAAVIYILRVFGWLPL